MARSKAVAGSGEGAGKKKATPLEPDECMTHMRQKLAEEFEEIVKGFVEAAKKGSCPHVKLVTELLRMESKQGSRKTGSVAKLVEKLDWEQMERERVEMERGLGCTVRQTVDSRE